MKIICIISIFLIHLSLAAQKKGLPIIDMHMHAETEIWLKESPCYPRADCTGIKVSFDDPKELMPLITEQMDKYNIVLGVLSGKDLNESYRWANTDSRFMVGFMIGDPNEVNLSPVKKGLDEGKIKIMGEITSAYYGLTINDPSLDSVFQLANQYDVPVQAHVTGTGAGIHYPITKADPLLVSEVIQKYPDLRIYIENAGFPYVDKTVSLMYIYPNVFGDLSTLTWIAPRKVFHKYLQELIDAGLGKQLMFGSDHMLWPEAIGMAIEAIESAEFLTEGQKRDIFYNNAARFLRLGDEVIEEHHEN